MSIADDLNSTNDTATDPKGWEQYSERIGDQMGSATIKLPNKNSTERDLLETAGFNPDEWKIDGPVQTRKWMRYDQEWCYYFKFNVKAGESKEAKQLDIEELTKFIRSASPKSANAQTEGDTFAFFMSDLQIGKAYKDISSEVIMRRYMDCVDQAVERVKDLRKTGKSITHGAIIGLGDIVESCSGFYPNQEFNIDLNYRFQQRVAREVLTYTIKSFLPLFDQLTVAAVGGNHGQIRSDGKVRTDDADNMDVAVFDSVKEAFDLAGVELDWVLPYDELFYTLDLGGVPVGVTHGHLARRGGTTVQAKNVQWWKDQMFGGDFNCQVLVTGHYHHFSAVSYGNKTHLQCPAHDAGSKWYSDSSGEASPQGVLTVRFDKNNKLGWDDLKVIEPR